MQSCELAGLRHSSLLGVTRPAVAVMLLTFGSVTAQRGTPPCAPRDLKSMGLTAAAAALTNTSPGRLRMCTGRQSKEHVAPMRLLRRKHSSSHRQTHRTGMGKSVSSCSTEGGPTDRMTAACMVPCSVCVSGLKLLPILWLLTASGMPYVQGSKVDPDQIFELATRGDNTLTTTAGNQRSSTSAN